jgi:23S rRNA (uracil1939-C5)-methyltransferase
MHQCQHHKECGACSLWGISYADEEALKRARINAILNQYQLPEVEVEFHSAGFTQVRDRVDLQWRAQAGWGFYQKSEKKILPIEHCLLLTPSLLSLFNWFRKIELPVPIASARLRVSPLGRWGVWIDTANLHIKTLLEEKKFLMQVLEKAFVEIGQRRKKLVEIKGELKLKDPEFQDWFCTFDQKENAMPLFSCVGSFTQVGFKVNQLLIDSVLRQIVLKSGATFFEIGAGVGNFTLPLLAEGFRVLALESDKLALAALQANLEQNFSLFLPQIQIVEGDFTQINQAFFEKNFNNIDLLGLLVDPPRSGLQTFLDYDFWQIQRFTQIIYVSCSLDSWGRDAQKLASYAYQLEKIIVVNQFPRSEHIETISVWR